jgi:hypothetical protein
MNSNDQVNFEGLKIKHFQIALVDSRINVVLQSLSNHLKLILMKDFLAKNLLICCLIVLMACNDDRERTSYASVTAQEKTVFEKLALISPEANNIWSDYHSLTQQPAYLIFTDLSGKGIKGYVLNAPKSFTNNMLPVDPEEAFGLSLFQSNDFLTAAETSIGEGGIYTIDLDLNGTTFFAMKDFYIENFYNNYKDQDNNFTPLVMTHEMFHMYQFDNWDLPDDWVQDFYGYPTDKEQIALHLLLFELMKRSYFIDNELDKIEYLKYYVSLRTEMITKDTSTAKLVKSMGTNQELIEGTARYVEHFAALHSIYPSINQDPTHGWEGYLNDVADNTSLRVALAVRIWYHVGAAATNLLKEAGVDIENAYKTGKTPFEVASDYLKLSNEDLTEYLQSAKDKVDYPAYLADAESLSKLP